MPIIKQNDIIDVIYETICGYEPEEAYKILELYQAKQLIPIEWMYEWRIKNNEQYNVGLSSFSQMISDWEKENEG